MANVWKPNRGYSILKPYVNFCCKSIFSRVRVSGLENVPADGYVMYAPNHCATLMDPLLLLTTRRGALSARLLARRIRLCTCACYCRYDACNRCSYTHFSYPSNVGNQYAWCVSTIPIFGARRSKGDPGIAVSTKPCAPSRAAKARAAPIRSNPIRPFLQGRRR